MRTFIKGCFTILIAFGIAFGASRLLARPDVRQALTKQAEYQDNAPRNLPISELLIKQILTEYATDYSIEELQQKLRLHNDIELVTLDSLQTPIEENKEWIALSEHDINELQHGMRVIAKAKGKRQYFLPIGDSDYIFVLGPYFYHPRPQSMIYVIITVGLIILLTIATAVIILLPFIKQIRKLEDMTLRISQGDFNVRADISGNDSVARLAERFNQMAESNQKYFEQQKQLLQAVAHELRTPIARIRFSLELLNYPDDAATLKRMQSIDDDLNEIDSLVKELSYFNFVDSNSAQTNLELCDLYLLTEAVYNHLEVFLENFDVVLDGKPNSAFACVDETAFKRVITNLLNNAVRYAKKVIIIRIKPMETEIEIAIEDDGIGIPEADRKHVLEPFHCLDVSRSKQKGGGVGLGLAIVDRIIKKHKGRIIVEESDLGGARFATFWPRAHQHPKAIGDNENSEKKAPADEA